ncbi:MAG TPA: alpha/beta hydrolase family protein [Saprospiraceae bacterium]|nr:alpha/beta hydrolase family protein [Saprospiraceae bacterium]
MKRTLTSNLLIFILLMTTESIFAAHVDTLQIFSAVMQKTSNCLVITPDNYQASGKPYPVLYLLHGWSGNFAGWLSEAPQLKEHADHYQMLIVCPDGGYDSWYLDSPVDSAVRYDTYISREVVNYIDYYFNTIKAPSGRAIAGLSMGGHGAITLAIKHMDVFGAAGSMAGGLDLRAWKKNDWDLKGVLGDPSEYWDNWVKASAVTLAERLKGKQLPLIIDCGIDDFFLEANREMHRVLLELDYPHEYTERPGEHNGEYWGSAVDFQVLFFHKFFSPEEFKN